MRVVLAPARAWSKQDLRRPWPSPRCLGYVRRFLFGPWPVEFTRKHMFREGGAALYAGAMLLTLLWFSPVSLGAARWPLILAAGIGSAVLWWLLPALAVAVNEDGWHPGGYLLGIAVFLWHGLVFAWYLLLLAAHPEAVVAAREPAVYLFLDLFLLMFVVLAFGCNASGAIIALAEMVRRDERREIRQASHVFLQFRTRLWHVDIFNLIPMVSARPAVYYVALIVAYALIGLNFVQSFAQYRDDPGFWSIVLRDVFVLVLVAWQAFWYSAAFMFLKREVEPR
jgi:hypothetical protein